MHNDWVLTKSRLCSNLALFKTLRQMLRVLPQLRSLGSYVAILRAFQWPCTLRCIKNTTSQIWKFNFYYVNVDFSILTSHFLYPLRYRGVHYLIEKVYIRCGKYDQRGPIALLTPTYQDVLKCANLLHKLLKSFCKALYIVSFVLKPNTRIGARCYKYTGRSNALFLFVYRGPYGGLPFSNSACKYFEP